VPNQDQAINYVDSDKHVATLGGGFDVWSLRLDAATFFQYLIPKTVTKVTPPAGTTYVGSPGYKIGGWVAGAVVTMSSEL
jgi:hypothetical protein